MADDSTQRSHSPAEKPKYDWDDRRKGLTTAEKACMSSRPQPSPAARERMMAGDSPQATRRTAMTKKKSERPVRVARVAEEPNPLIEQEQTCTSILNRILPLPESDIVPSTHKLSQSGKLGRASSRSSRQASRQHGGSKSGRSGSRERNASRESGPPKTPGSGRGNPPATPSLPAGPQASVTSDMNRTSDMAKTGEVEAERPHLGGLLKRRDIHFDPANDPELCNVVRLIQGAMAARIERQVGGKIVFIQHEDIKESEKKDKGAQFASQQSGGHPLHIFRKKMMDRHGSVQAAFNSLNVDAGRRLDMREFCDMLSKSKLCSMMEARLIYDLLDADHDGNLTLPELQTGLECVALATSVEQLRKRLICLGFTSMIAAVSIMNGPGEDITHLPLTLAEFAVCLKRVWVMQDVEHRALYDCVRDPLGADSASSKASLSDLAVALQAISPCLLTEEVRPHLERRWGSVQKAYAQLNEDWLESVDAFCHDAKDWHGLEEREAARLFMFCDIDGGGSLERYELTGVLELSRPSLDMEECRKKVQQSHRCIEQSLRGAVTHDTEELNDTLKFLMHELEEILEPLDMDRKEKYRLASFIGDAAGAKQNGISLSEFFRGIKLLTPSCVLESIRLKILMVHKRVTDAFRGIRNRRVPMGRDDFQRLLRDVGVALDEETMDGLMDVMDIRSTGYVTLTEFIAALSTSEIGTRKKLPKGEAEAHSEKVVRDGFARLSTTVTEIKQGLRTLQEDQGPAVEVEPEEPKTRNKPLNRSASMPGNKMSKGGAGTSSAPTLPPARDAQRPNSSSSNASELKVVWSKNTLKGVSAAFGTPLDQERKKRTMEELHGYVDNQLKVQKDQEVALVDRFRKAALERHVSSLKRTIMPALQLKYQAGLLH